MSDRLTSTHRMTLSTLFLTVVALFLAWLVDGLLALLLAGVICLIVVLLSAVFMPPGWGAMRLRTLSALLFFGIAASYGYWQSLLNAAVAVLARSPQVIEKFPFLRDLKFEGEPSLIVLFSALAGLWIVNRYLPDPTTTGTHPVPLEKDLNDELTRRRLKDFCDALREHLSRIDRESNWSPAYYADLEAEVEIATEIGGHGRKKVLDLQMALRKQRDSRAFLVLGDPGSGKSVALRKLARDLLDEVSRSGRIPIYISLREWVPREGDERPWTATSKPRMEELERFVIDHIKQCGDVFIDQFVEQNFRHLWDKGRLFFIFDAFDEIPELLDQAEDSQLIDALSSLLYRFINTNSASRGLVASRLFRRPTRAFAARKTLEIRPLNEERIRQGLLRWKKADDPVLLQLFRDRPDLVSIARNPLMMALLGEWMGERTSLPGNQAELYKDYLTKRLSLCQARIAAYGLSESQVLAGATEIAWFVFNNPALGLEAPLRLIDNIPSLSNSSEIVELLSYARLARVTQSEPRSVAFVHRRFLEYLVATQYLAGRDEVPVEHVATDSRGREVLVLYAQVCDLPQAERIAAANWEQVVAHAPDSEFNLRAVHCLRFLIDAYSTRKDAVQKIADAIGTQVHKRLQRGENLVHAKICLEATGLLSAADALTAFKLAFASGNSWLQETAFRACRKVPSIDSSLRDTLLGYLAAIPELRFWRERKNLLFSLSLSDSLNRIYTAALWRKANLVSCWICVTAAAIFLSPVAAPLALLAAFLAFSVANSRLASAIGFLGKIRRKPGIRPTYTDTGPFKLEDYVDVFLRYFRRLFSYLLLLISAVLFVLPQEPETAVGMAREPGENIWTPTMLIGALATVIGTTDWLHIRVWWSKNWNLTKSANPVTSLLAMSWRSIRKAASVSLQNAIGLALLALLISGGYFAVRKINGGPIPLFLIIALASPVLASAAFRYSKQLHADFLTLRRISSEQHLSRREIAEAIDKLNFKASLLRVVRLLARPTTKVSGEWPDGKSPVVGMGFAMTELAKLDERWRNLDR